MGEQSDRIRPKGTFTYDILTGWEGVIQNRDNSTDRLGDNDNDDLKVRKQAMLAPLDCFTITISVS